MAAAGALAGVVPEILAQSPVAMTAAVIGHTGRGDYGHGLDLLFTGRNDVRLVALADADPNGRARAVQRTGAPKSYGDYREMLAQEKPQLVAVAPRWTDQRHAMVLVALRSGAHVFSEKPFTRTLAEADELLSVAASAGRKIAVAHQMRLAPNIVFLKKHLENGGIGKLLEIRAHGKQDSRAGGEDLLVLGVHLFHLMRFFAGDPLWCTARVLHNGREVTAADARPATEGIGRVLGDEISAQFAFPDGVNGTFTSRGANREAAGPWGLELVGSKGTVRVLADICPRVYLRDSGPWSAPDRLDRWAPIPGDPMQQASDAQKTVAGANARLVDDWLEAIRRKGEPACSGHSAMNAVEMAMAVFAAGLSKARIDFPLKDRQHPLER